MEMRGLLQLAYVVLLAALGTACVFFPRGVQAYAVRAAGMGITGRSAWLRAYLESSNYLLGVRAVGIVAYLMAAVLAVALLRGGTR